MRLVEAKCASCGAQMKLYTDKDTFTCDYCGTQHFIDDENASHKATDNYDSAYEQEMARLHAQRDFEKKYRNHRAKRDNWEYEDSDEYESRSFGGSSDGWHNESRDDSWIDADYRSDVSEKSRLLALILCFFLGGIGVHRFYLGRIGLGILYLFSGGLFGFGWFIDFFLILLGSIKDGKGRRVERWEL